MLISVSRRPLHWCWKRAFFQGGWHCFCSCCETGVVRGLDRLAAVWPAPSFLDLVCAGMLAQAIYVGHSTAQMRSLPRILPSPTARCCASVLQPLPPCPCVCPVSASECPILVSSSYVQRRLRAGHSCSGPQRCPHHARVTTCSVCRERPRQVWRPCSHRVHR